MKIVSNDGEEFEIDGDIGKQSTLLQQFFDNGVDGPCPLQNVKGSTLKLVIEFCDHHKNDPETNVDGQRPSYVQTEWDQKYADRLIMDTEILFEVIQAANYLDIKNLLNFTCRIVAHMIKDKTPEQIREMFETKLSSSNVQ